MSTTLEGHPLALLFPPMKRAELDSLAESIKLSGLREPIVLLEDKILDGLNRYQACNIAAVSPRFREFGDRETDGTSPARFVMDANLQHRFLDTSQRAAIGVEMLPFFEAEAEGQTDAKDAVATTMNVSKRTLEAAVETKKLDPQGFEQVKRGQKTVATANREAKEKNDSQRTEQLEETESKLLEPIRKKHRKEMEKSHGEGFATAFENGVILKTEKQLNDFLAMPKADQKLITHLVVEKWDPNVALKFMHRVITPDDKLKDLVLQAAGLEKPIKVLVNGWIVTARKAQPNEPGV